MKWLIDGLYELAEFEEEDFDFYDLYYLLKSPHTIRFDYEDRQYIIRTEQEDGMCAVQFDGKWFRDRDEFFQKAVIGDKKATALYNDFYGWKVLA